MKLKVLLISLLLLAPLAPSISATPPKAGEICRKAGVAKNYNGKKYTCVKSGKKLVWNKGVIMKSPAPELTPIPIPTTSPTTSQSPSPAPTNIVNPNPIPTASLSPMPSLTPTAPLTSYERFKETSSKALKNFDIWRLNPAPGKPESKIEYWFGSSVPLEIVSESKRKLDNAVSQWERFHKVTRSKIFLDLALPDQIVEKCRVMAPRSAYFTLDWCKNFTENNLKSYFNSAAAFESEGGWRPILAPKLSPAASVTHSFVLLEPIVFYTDAFFATIEHEWFHQIQYDLTGNHYIREYPVWFVEGSASYLGLLSATMDDPNYFVQARAQNFLRYSLHNDRMSKSDFLSWIAKYTVPRLSYTDNTDNWDGSAYTYGAIAAEWLVGKIGFKGLVEMLRDVEDLGWKRSFEKHLGKPQEAYFEEIATYIYTEYEIVQANRSWLFLPNCKSRVNGGTFEAKKGVCFSMDGRVP
jgi:hypothetical protein